MKDNSVKKDLIIAGISIVAFYVLLIVATWIDGIFGLSSAFTLVDVASLVMKVGVCSAVVWAWFRIVYKNTLGKDFGDVFDKGWAALEDKEKARWILGVSVAVLAIVVYAATSTVAPAIS